MKKHRLKVSNRNIHRNKIIALQKYNIKPTQKYLAACPGEPDRLRNFSVGNGDLLLIFSAPACSGKARCNCWAWLWRLAWKTPIGTNFRH
jgi:hypothetical protein